MEDVLLSQGADRPLPASILLDDVTVAENEVG